MVLKKKLYKSCLLLGASISIGSIVGFSLNNNTNNINNTIIKSNTHTLRTNDINGTIYTVDNHDYVEVNISDYEVDLNSYIVNVDQTSESGIPLQNDFKIKFDIVSDKTFRVYRTSVRKYYRLYILEKNNNNATKQYFRKVIKVDNFRSSGGSINNAIQSNVNLIDLNDANNKNKYNSYLVNKGAFIKNEGLNEEFFKEMKTWDMGKVYDELNGIFFNSSNKTTFINEVNEIGYLIEKNSNAEDGYKTETLHLWMILKENYYFQVNNENSFLVTSDFKIEINSPPPINGDDNITSNKNSSTNQTTIFAISITTVLLFLIAIILFITISNKNKVRQKRNYDLEKAIKNRSKN